MQENQKTFQDLFNEEVKKTDLYGDFWLKIDQDLEPKRRMLLLDEELVRLEQRIMSIGQESFGQSLSHNFLEKQTNQRLDVIKKRLLKKLDQRAGYQKLLSSLLTGCKIAGSRFLHGLKNNKTTLKRAAMVLGLLAMLTWFFLKIVDSSVFF